MKRLIVVAIMLSACKQADAPTTPALTGFSEASLASLVEEGTIRVSALIDGRSRLILRRNTAQWYHLDFAAPGKWAGRNDPTTINGVQWLPSWPGYSGEVRCGGCFSEVFEGVSPALPATRSTIVVTPVQARLAVVVTQQPEAKNDYTAIVEIDDNAWGGADTYIVDISFTAVNLPPVAVAPLLVVASCVARMGAVTLDGSASHDDDGAIVSYAWSGAANSSDAVGTFSLPLGSHEFQLAVTDNDGASATTGVTARVEDNDAPSIELNVLKTALWPPNHEMHLVASGVGATDVCDATPDVFVDVSSSESSNSRGDGNTALDWRVERSSDGTYDVYLRAETSGKGTDRVYTIRVTAMDATGNRAQGSASVRVALGRGR